MLASQTLLSAVSSFGCVVTHCILQLAVFGASDARVLYRQKESLLVQGNTRVICVDCGRFVARDNTMFRTSTVLAQFVLTSFFLATVAGFMLGRIL